MMTAMNPLVVVMGVSGSGKSTVGALLAERLDVPFIDADDLHPRTNIEKMAAGLPLDDNDRWPWLEAVGRTLADQAATGLVVACSALRQTYRDAIRLQSPSTRFVQLDGSPELLASRLGAREGHFMPPALLNSQLDTLEPLGVDESGLVIDIGQAAEIVSAQAAAWLEDDGVH